MPSTTVSDQTLYVRFRRSAHRHGTRVACQSEAGAITYSALAGAVADTADGLRNGARIGVGDSVALVAGNSIEWLVASLAVQRLGGVEVPANPDLEVGALTGLIERMGCVAVITDNEAVQSALAHGNRWPRGLRAVVSAGGGDGSVVGKALDLGALRVSGRLVASPQTAAAVEADAPAAVIHTSGTTAAPKAVRLSQRNLTHSMIHLPAMLGIGARDDILLCLPLWHLYGRLIAYLALGCGATLHLGDPYRLDAELRRTRPTLLPAFPIIWEHFYRGFADALDRAGALRTLQRTGVACSLRYLAARDRVYGSDDAGRRALSADIARLVSLAPLHALNRLACRLTFRRRLGGRLRSAIVGDALMPRAVDEGLRAMGFNVLEGYGSTEQVVSTMRTLAHNVPGTVGRPLPDVDVRILDAAGGWAERGRIGEVAVAGPQVCLGYWRDPERDARAFFHKDGKRFHRTGDMGWLNRNGDLRFVGRASNVLWPDSENPVYPELTENAVLASRLIERTVLYPRSDHALGILLVPDFRELCQRLGPPPGADAARLLCAASPAEWADFAARESAPLANWLRDEAVVAVYRRALLGALLSERLPPHQKPSHFRLLWRQLRVDDELTPTLKLKRRVIHERLRSWGDEYPLNPELPSRKRAPGAVPRDRVAVSG